MIFELIMNKRTNSYPSLRSSVAFSKIKQQAESEDVTLSFVQSGLLIPQVIINSVFPKQNMEPTTGVGLAHSKV